MADSLHLLNKQIKQHVYRDRRPSFHKSSDYCRWSFKQKNSVGLVAITVVICVFIVKYNHRNDDEIGYNVSILEPGTVFDYSEFQDLPSSVHDELKRKTLQRKQLEELKSVPESNGSEFEKELRSSKDKRHIRNIFPSSARGNNQFVDNDGSPFLIVGNKKINTKNMQDFPSRMTITQHSQFNNDLNINKNEQYDHNNDDCLPPCPLHPPNLREYFIIAKCYFFQIVIIFGCMLCLWKRLGYVKILGYGDFHNAYNDCSLIGL